MTVLAASTLALDFSGGGGYIRGTFENFGWEFDLSQSRTVDALGLFDYGANGLADAHEVGLWDSEGDLLATAVITNSDPATPSADPALGDWRFQSIAPITLAAGSYVIGAYYPTSADPFVGNATGIVTDPDVTYVEGRISPGVVLGFAEPQGTFTGGDPGFLGPDFRLAALPEPADWMLMLGGCFGLGAALRRARGKHPAAVLVA